VGDDGVPYLWHLFRLPKKLLRTSVLRTTSITATSGVAGLAKPYLIAFWLLTGTFLLALPPAGATRTDFGLLVLTIGALACLLMRMRVVQPDAEVFLPPPTGTPAEVRLLNELGRLLEPTSRKPRDVGLMLVTVRGGIEDDPSELRSLDFVRAQLAWVGDFAVAPLDPQVLAVAASGPRLDIELERLATTLHREANWRRSLAAPSGSEVMTIGVALAHGGRSRPSELLQSARAALSAAEAHNRPLLFRHLG
jgi:hypothetical protein